MWDVGTAASVQGIEDVVYRDLCVRKVQMSNGIGCGKELGQILQGKEC